MPPKKQTLRRSPSSMGRKEDDGKIESLIIAVKKYPCLYNQQSPMFKDSNKKKSIWKEIAQHVDFGVPAAKKKWKTVRDNYRKYKNNLKSKNGQAAKVIAPYKFSGILGFLDPFLEDKESAHNPGENGLERNEVDEDSDNGESPAQPGEEVDGEEITNDDNEQIFESAGDNSGVSSRPATPFVSVRSGNRRRAMQNQTVYEGIVDVFTKKRALMNKCTVPEEEKDDDIDYFMKSMAISIRNLPASDRADVKYKIHGVVHKAEMCYLSHLEND